MTLEVAGISLKVDSTDAVTAKANLDKMAAAGATSAAAFSQVEAGARTAGAALSGTAAAAAAGSKGIASTASGAKGAADALKATGAQAKLTGNQTAQLSAQLQDLFVQVQAGGSPLTALIQQGSQLSAVFGGVAPALRAVASAAFSTAGLALALGAAVIGVGAAFAIAEERSSGVRRALILSGNAAGLTEGEFNNLAKSVAAYTATSVASTKETMQGLVASGRFTADTLGQAAIAAQLLGKASGDTSDEVVKNFARAADGPAAFAREIQKSNRIFTASQLDAIQKAEDQGKTTEALSLIFGMLIPRLTQASQETSKLAGWWRDLKRTFSDAGEGVTAAGNKLDELTAKLEKLQAARGTDRGGRRRSTYDGQIAEAQAAVEAERAIVAAKRASAAEDAKRAKTESARDAFMVLQDRYLTREELRKKAIAELDAKSAAAGSSAADRAKVLAEINQRFDNGQNKAKLGFDIEQIKAQEEQRLNVYRQSEGVLEALRQAGTVVDREYYDAKRAFVELDRLTQEGALNAEIARLQQFKGAATEQLEVRKQIAQAQAKLSEVQASAATKAVILNVQEQSSVDALKRAFTELEFAAVAAYSATTRKAEFTASTVGKSDQRKDRAAEEFNIREQYARQLQTLEADLRNGSLRGREDEYRRRRQLLLDNQDFELQATADGYRKLDAERTKWQNGVTAALGNYRDQAVNTAGQVQAAMENAAKGMEDALVNFVTTGKLNFNDLATSIVADITRIIVKQQIVAPLMQALGGGGGSGGGALGGLFSGLFGGGRATGGPVSAGKLYEVNERGRSELLNVGGRQYLMAGQNGSVTPSAGAAGGMSQVNHFHISGPVDRRTQQQIATAAGRGAQQAMARNG